MAETQTNFGGGEDDIGVGAAQGHEMNSTSRTGDASATELGMVPGTMASSRPPLPPVRTGQRHHQCHHHPSFSHGCSISALCTTSTTASKPVACLSSASTDRAMLRITPPRSLVLGRHDNMVDSARNQYYVVAPRKSHRRPTIRIRNSIRTSPSMSGHCPNLPHRVPMSLTSNWFGPELHATKAL